ncbi:uncharacterized protein [Mytilus edulis]|uniref:uncharacterized protein n=1 Tax=Mytilus edulis TaxID=6550 RepID=UPI0039F10A08
MKTIKSKILVLETLRCFVKKKKSNVIHFRPSSVERSTFNFFCGSHSLVYVDSYKYLGIWFSEHVTWNKAVKELSKSASRALSCLTVKFYAYGGMTYQVFTKLYESLVQPILLYGASIWGNTEHRLINNVQNRASKIFLGVTKLTSNTAVQGDLGWLSCHAKQRLEVLRFFYKLETRTHTRTFYKIHLWSKRKRRSWNFNVIKLFRNMSVEHLMQPGISKELFFKVVKSKLRILELLIPTCIMIVSAQETMSTCPKASPIVFELSMSLLIHFGVVSSVKSPDCASEVTLPLWFTKLWNDNSNVNGNKLRLYRRYKKDLQPEHYVTNAMPRHLRSNLCKLRCGTLPLSVETGRYTKPPIPLEERICPFCNDAVEDEIHFLINCDIYSDLRFNLFHRAMVMDNSFCTKSDFNQFVFLIQNAELQYELSILVHNMIRRRRALKSNLHS